MGGKVIKKRFHQLKARIVEREVLDVDWLAGLPGRIGKDHIKTLACANHRPGIRRFL